MLSNVAAIEQAAAHTAVNNRNGAILLFDFAAAFPSISQEFLRTTLEYVGVPNDIRNVVDALYFDNDCEISLGGQKWEGFTLTVGVRQGCPLSPLLFVIVADILLRRPHQDFTGTGSHAKRHTDVTIRAFADGTAMTLDDVRSQLPRVIELFQQCGDISGMKLAVHKTVLIPLRPLRTPAQETATMQETYPAWARVNVTHTATHLGYFIGPGKSDTSWDKPLDKYRNRLTTWGALRAGTQYAIASYESYVLPVLSFISQLETPPPHVLAAERKGLNRICRGPGNWFITHDLYYAKEQYGQTRSITSLRTLAMAAKARVATLELSEYRARAQELRNLLLTSRDWQEEGSHACHTLMWHRHLEKWFQLTPYWVLEHAVSYSHSHYNIQPKRT